MDKRPMITIVDDDESVRDATASLIRAAGFAPKAFPTADDFLNSGEVRGTDFLIADVHMPGMSGLELYGTLRQAGTSIPTILITAYPDDKVRQRALEAGVVSYLTKPFNASDLIECIETALQLGNTTENES
jgi:FixJ family two-component response regulator